MDLARIRPVYDHPGPFATVYLEGRSPGEDAPQQVRLRWKALREQLATDGAEATALDALESRLFDEEAGEVQTDGRVLVATSAGVLLDASWDATLGSGDAAHWTQLPELGAFVRERTRSVRLLVAIANQQGAVVRREVAAEQHDLNQVDSSAVDGGSIEGVHKPRGGALAHKQIQRRADEAVQQNAKDIVAHLARAAQAFNPGVLVLAGEVQGRTAIRNELPADLATICVEAERGGTEDDGAEAALAEQLREIASQESERAAATQTEQFAEAKAHGLAIDGAEAVARAAEMGAVGTLLLRHNQPASDEHADEAALLHAATVGGAEVQQVDSEIADGVAAMLRFAIDPDNPARDNPERTAP